MCWLGRPGLNLGWDLTLPRTTSYLRGAIGLSMVLLSSSLNAFEYTNRREYLPS